MWGETIIKLSAYSYPDIPLKDSKRIYVDDIVLSWECPECGSNMKDGNNYDAVWASYGRAPLYFCCRHCDFEPDEEMFTLNYIGEDYIDITLSDSYNLKCLKVKTVYEEMRE